ncbi:hypothetical protein J4218_02995 [Candidatus Pacearchaeota archaeon]|nr:hypothetical protein [Candidatus Pacearchaeota archaeon]
MLTELDTSEGKRYTPIPKPDVDEFNRLYNALPHQNLPNPRRILALDMGSRLYIEMCLEGIRPHIYEKTTEIYDLFVRDETHLELVRSGCPWDHASNQFTSLSAEQYKQTRDKVLAGLALRAIELFTDWEGKISPPGRRDEQQNYVHDDKRNLRADLRDYIARAEQLLQQPQAA